MARRIIAVVILLVLMAFGYVWYRNYQTNKQIDSGDVHSVNSTPTAPASVSMSTTNQAPQTVTQPAAAQPDPVTGISTTSTTATTSTTQQPTAASSVRTAAANMIQPGSSSASQAAPPARDTISPNPPNGMTFTGNGRYQWYRQGNLTWRIDTQSGVSCIAFATDDEWRKPRVYQDGCGNR